MRRLFLYIAMMLILHPFIINGQNIVKQKQEILVLKIDSTPDYIIIYGVSDNNSKYKIVTRKVASDCRNVFLSKKYNLTLMSLNENDPIKTMNRCDVHYGWGGSNIILNEPEWNCDIYLADEIFGLCYTTDVEKIKQYEEWVKQHPIESKRTKIEQQSTKSKCIKKRILKK